VKLNKNQKQILFYGLLTLLLIGFLTYIVKAEAKRKNAITGGGVNLDNPFPLKFGAMGVEVGQLQNYLNQRFKANLEVDEKLGPKTLEAMKRHLNRDSISEAYYIKAAIDTY
jgi:peptidoglycan hydrolase-like protein with peptidoglycan-binding domain